MSRLRRLLPSTFLVPCIKRAEASHRDTALFARNGADFLGILDEAGLEEVIARRTLRCVQHFVEAERWPVHGTERDEFTSHVVSWVFRNGFRDLRCRHVVAWFGLDHGTLNRHLRRVGAGLLHRQVVAARMFHLAIELERHRPLVAVADELGFPTVDAMKKFMMRASAADGSAEGLSRKRGAEIRPCDWAGCRHIAGDAV